MESSTGIPLVNMFSELNQTPPLEMLVVRPTPVSNFLIDREAPLDPPFPVRFAAERSIFVGFGHQTPPSIAKLPRATRRLKLSLVI
jgi:hypothetical protein